VRGLRAGGVIVEAQLATGAPLAGRLVSEAPWPREAVLVAVERNGALVVPRGDLRLLVGDHVSIFATPEARPEVDDLLDVPGIEPAPELTDGRVASLEASDR
jgi:Trk K+ transport system NAD-binding subunit